MNRIAIIAAAAVSTAFMSSAATAAETFSVEVFYGDLDTQSEAGAKTLAERVKRSLKIACESPDIRSPRSGANWEECKQAALTQVTEQLAGLGVKPTVTIG